MNFKRIQEIFLLVFIVIDIFLFTMTKSNKIQPTNTPVGNADNTIIKEMKHDSISVGKLSNQRLDGYYLSATQDNNLESQFSKLKNQDARIDSNTVVSTFRNIIKVDENDPHKTIDHLMKKNGFVLDGKYFLYNKHLSNKNKVVYDQMVVNSTVLSSNARITFNITKDHHLSGYTQRELNNIKILHEKSELISEEHAVIRLYQYNEIPNNSKVLWTKLAYTHLLHIGGEDVYIPTWMIATESKTSHKKQIKRINAFNGASFKTEKVKIKNNSQNVESENNQ
ncbi:hypothetical protein BGL34_04875 [Fructilactobacillus lindneri]|uniref:Regulatory protein YycH-like domain-containing protein n=2 Tax=Fructilactobacillus lindneri TaxID=53444 RepID=A0A0R2JM57_9LACO|nr:two-component system regulatory protein YycI [Fructilactobacillus lindneri]ANZ57533.1 hypothetical protein AYR60_01425 [Fructilactobacillus lindneri]ANZ58801.1 hypothetical protein AYR59_01425 [Fructilactobacillus lindneri]KRN78287.1 hypothetical protein IV52_GL001421 [Fructilactobacillus lindneri DSM 20690 = JCM 11027]POG97707.1 hypothetical protein BGL31_06330 [Fructilactobacillus lindneri]POH00094.1 hypothetical protein BGL32_04895 [Fructilactobacillus lindneri]